MEFLGKVFESNTKSRVSEAIDKYVSNHADEDIIKNWLIEEDWQVLRNIYEFLELLEDVALDLEGHKSTLNLVLPANDLVLHHYETFKVIYWGKKMMKATFNAGWRKLNKYYKLTDCTPAYVAITILDTNLKWAYSRHHWATNWVKENRGSNEEYLGEALQTREHTISCTNSCV